MFCPKCGKELPEGSKFCPKCGAQISSEAVSQTKQGTSEDPRATSIEGSESRPSRRSHLPLIIGGAVIIVLIAVAAFVLLGVGKFAAASKLPNGTFTFNDATVFGFSYRVFDGDDGEETIQLGDLTDAGKTFNPMYEGVLHEDGSNAQGTIWKIENLQALDNGFPTLAVWPERHSNVRVQFPAGAAEGHVEGRWYFEAEVVGDSDGQNTTEFAIREFDEDGRAKWVSGSGEGVIDRGLTYDEVLADDSLDIEMTLEDGDSDVESGGYGPCTWRDAGGGRFEVVNSDDIVVLKVLVDPDSTE